MNKVTLVDYWAPWCVDLQTPILTENGYLKASEVKLGQRLVTIDPKTKYQSLKIVKKLRVFKNVPSKKIILETGKKLIGDENHQVLTQEGFKKLIDLKVGEKILVNPGNEVSVFNSNNQAVILETAGNNFSDKALKELDILPLKASDSRVSILARILGFVMTDGYLYKDLKHNIYETHFFVGTEKDAQDIKRDIQSLGFDRLEIKKRANKRQIDGREFTITTLRCRNFNRAFFFLLKSLGAPVGRKKNQAYFIPDWIMTGDLAVKRGFLSGWLGGDGSKIDYRMKRKGLSSHYGGFTVNAIEFHKEKNLEKEGVLYASQLAILFEELGVRVNDTSSVDDDDGVIISLKLATDYNSLLNLAKIGYVYAQTKNSRVPFIKEFLEYRLFERNRYAEVKQMVMQQLSLGIDNKVIAQNFQIPARTVVSWKYDKLAKTTHPSNSGEAKFNDWLEDRQQEDLLWVKVYQTEESGVRDVVGITVDNPHTLVTNGIVSHNCGPCKIMDPIIDELEKEMGEKLEVQRVNVDEEPEKASAAGVMSIPTYVILKDGKEVSRKIGVTAKSELKKLIETN